MSYIKFELHSGNYCIIYHIQKHQIFAVKLTLNHIRNFLAYLVCVKCQKCVLKSGGFDSLIFLIPEKYFPNLRQLPWVPPLYPVLLQINLYPNFKNQSLNPYRWKRPKVDASIFDSALSHTQDIFACGQVSSPCLYR